jgi:hypothetical protein
VGWIKLVQDGEQWQTAVNTVNKSLEDLSTTYVTISLLRMTLFHAIRFFNFQEC